ncbi:hypothetical protein TIFTF001_032153 [Ficus carica]|uniref:Uncharacterized protein n=1 Tax=Ficus carica TaxID=3494 RepID=A0AA88J227_FICCA|nr:hypothetical protein TIFTF001_032153 [Ficus carica]
MESAIGCRQQDEHDCNGSPDNDRLLLNFSIGAVVFFDDDTGQLGLASDPRRDRSLISTPRRDPPLDRDSMARSVAPYFGSQLPSDRRTLLRLDGTDVGAGTDARVSDLRELGASGLGCL